MWRDDIYKPSTIDRFFIEDTALQQLILEAIIGVKGVTGLAPDFSGLLKKPIKIIRSKEKLKIKIYLLGAYGENLREVGAVVRERIIKSLEELGGVEVERVDIIFKGVSRK